MTGSVNRVVLLGYVGRDPEIKSLKGGDRIANLSVATMDSWKDRTSGERREKTEWHRVVVRGSLVEVVEQHVKKGTRLYLEGKVQTRSWEDQGQKRHITEVVLPPYESKLVMLGNK